MKQIKVGNIVEFLYEGGDNKHIKGIVVKEAYRNHEKCLGLFCCDVFLFKFNKIMPIWTVRLRKIEKPLLYCEKKIPYATITRANT